MKGTDSFGQDSAIQERDLLLTGDNVFGRFLTYLLSVAPSTA